MKHIKFVYDENGDIDWEKTVIPRVDLTKVKFQSVEPSSEDKRLLHEIQTKEKMNER